MLKNFIPIIQTSLKPFISGGTALIKIKGGSTP
jgi:hypothetical protein